MGKSLKTASTQRTNFGLMAVTQQTVKPRVVTEQQIDVYLKAISAQRTDSSLMTILQWTTTPRVVANWQMETAGY